MHSLAAIGVGMLLLATAAVGASAGCAASLDGVVVALDGTQQALTASQDVILERLAAARKQAVDASPDKASAQKAVAAVEAKFAPAWEAYKAARLAWLEASRLTVAAQNASAANKSAAKAAAQKASDDAAKAVDAMAAALRATQ